MESIDLNQFLRKNILANDTALVFGKSGDEALDGPAGRIAVTPAAFAKLVGVDDKDSLSGEIIDLRIRTLLGLFYEALGKSGPCDCVRFSYGKSNYVALKWGRSKFGSTPAYTIMTAAEQRQIPVGSHSVN